MFCYSKNHFKKHRQVCETVTCKIFITLNFSRKHKILLFFTAVNSGTMDRVITITRPSFLITLISFLYTWPNFPNSWSGSRFSLKASKAQRLSVKSQPRVSKQIIDWDFCRREFLNIWSVESNIYSLKLRLDFLQSIFYQLQLKLFLEAPDSFFPIGYISYLCKIP